MEKAEKTQQTANEAIQYIQFKAGNLKRVDGKWKRLQERRLESRIKRQFNQQIEWIVAEMQKLSIFDETKSGVKFIERKYTQKELDDFLDDMDGQKEIADLIGNSGKTSYLKGAKTISKQFNMSEVGVSFELVSDDAIKYLKSKVTLHLSNNRGSINQTTKKRILNILVEAAEKGTNYQDTGRKIRAQGAEGVFSRSRAEMIAVNEIGNAYEEGNREMVDVYKQETGAEIQKLWIDSGDELVTPECEANGAQGWIGFQEDFLSGDLAAPRATNPRCRCSTGYRQVDSQGNEI
jgi:hypothetical protein